MTWMQLTTANLSSLRPMLAVTDLPRTIRFYVENLGFNCSSTFGDPPVWCELERDGVAIMFNAPPRAHVERDVPRLSKDYQIFYFISSDLPSLHAEFKQRGVQVSDLRVTIYQMKEFEVRDPDGYWLWFGQETDEPPTVQE
jgi:catechol 2,3-dioxygenase-like lactoylglutathione lyase family enzyme